LGRVLGFVLLIALVSVGRPSTAHAEAGASWIRPVDGAVVRAFDPPRSRFGAGHLGVDIAAAPGTPVRAAGPGVVVFAGRVAGARHVVVAHAAGLRTSYSFLASILVRRGQRVGAGDAVGTTGGTGDGHGGSVLHFGLRAGETYVDPMGLFRPVDLATIVHLAPTTDRPRPVDVSSERRGLLAGLAHAAGAVVTGAVDGVVGDASAAADAAGTVLVATNPLAAAVAGTADWFEQRQHCDPHAPPADGEGGSGHRVMFVAGIESSASADEPPLALPPAQLGYLPGEVTYFSYSGGRDYTAADTEGPIIVAARRLASQLRGMQRRAPGREVDLIAHSQGGVVVEAFLTLIYKPGDRSYPPLGTVVTLSSPLHGDPLASALAGVAGTDSGAAGLRAAARAASAVGDRLPLLAPAIRDLAAGSDLMKRLDSAHLPDEVQLTTVGAATDVIVPADAAGRTGARGTTVIPEGLNAHKAVLSDPSALRAVRAALENKPLPCQSLPTVVTGKVLTVTISSLEDGIGRLGEAAGHIADGRP
jgi:hypothetical protein